MLNDQEAHKALDAVQAETIARLVRSNARMDHALRYIGRTLASYHTENRSPTKDELFGLMSYALAGLGSENLESSEFEVVSSWTCPDGDGWYQSAPTTPPEWRRRRRGGRDD